MENVKVMKVIGMHIAKDQFRYTVLEGTKAEPFIIDRVRLTTPAPEDVPALMDWYDSQFKLVLDKTQPEGVAYRLTLATKKDQLFYSSFPFGVLNLHVHTRHLFIKAYAPQSFVASRLGLPQGTDLLDQCNKKFGLLSSPWDRNQKYSLLAAWFTLP